MNVLLLSQFYWPETRIAPKHLADLAEDLQDRGHRVTVVTGFPNHPLGRTYDGYQMKPWQWDDVRGVTVLRLPLIPDHSLSKIRRTVNFTSFAFSAATVGSVLTRKEEPDVVFCYLPPLTMALPVSVLRRIHGVPIVYWMTDLWLDGLIAAGVNMTPITRRLLCSLESYVYRQASRIFLTSPGFKENLIGKGVSSHKLTTLVDWADEAFFYPAAADRQLAREWSMDETFNVIYAGNLGTAQHLQTVVTAAQLLKECRDIQFIFIGDGTDKNNLRGLVRESQLGNVRFLPRQPFSEIHRYLALADLLIVHLKDDATYRRQIPSKTIPYLASGRPILCAVAGNTAEIVLDAGAGVSCPPDDPHAMARAVLKVYGMSPEERAGMGRRGRKAYLLNYTRVIQVARIERVLQELIDNCQMSH